MTASPAAGPHETAASWYDLPSDDEAAAGAVETFRATYGREPAGVWAAPGRVNVIGEHVDYNGGLCMPFALPHRTFVAVAGRDDGRLAVASGQDEHPWTGALEDVAPGTVDGWAGYAVGVPWALGRQGVALPAGFGFDAAVSGHVPLGAGLSSSAALECAVAVAVDELCGLGLAGSDAGRARLAAACVDAENDIAGAPTGGMDQAASLRGTAGHVLLLDCTDFSLEQVPFDCAADALELLVIDTRVHHALVDGQYGSRRDVCEEAARVLAVGTLGQVSPGELDAALEQVRASIDDPEQADEAARRVRHVVTEIERVRQTSVVLRRGRLRESGQLDRLAALLDASHSSLRDDYEVSCAELDVACVAARAAGAHGARMTGGGFGGSAIALVDVDQVDAVAQAVTKAFAGKGFRPPSFLRAVPSPAAARVR
jgi:galactokinase